MEKNMKKIGGREAHKGGDICKLIADSYWCTAESNAALYMNYPPIKKKNIYIYV